MTLPMLEALRTERVGVRMALVEYEDASKSVFRTILQKGGKYLPHPNDFAHLRIRVTNLSSQFFAPTRLSTL